MRFKFSVLDNTKAYRVKLMLDVSDECLISDPPASLADQTDQMDNYSLS